MVIQTDLADVEASSEEKRGMTLGGLTTGTVPWVTSVASVALTLERSFFVDAHLGTCAWICTFVYVWK